MCACLHLSCHWAQPWTLSQHGFGDQAVSTHCKRKTDAFGTRSLKPVPFSRRSSSVQPARKSGGGFFSGLNQKRRDGGVEQGKQVTLLLHTNKRLEDATHK